MNPSKLPRFSDIDIQRLPETLAALLDANRAEVAALLRQPSHDWGNLMAPLEALDDRLDKFWAPVSHLNSVMNSDELRVAYDACIPLLTAYRSEMGQNRPLFEAVQSLAQSDAFAVLDGARQRAIRNLLRDFRLSGVALEEAERQRFADIQQRLSELSTRFANNVLDATDVWEKWLPEPSVLSGVPEMVLESFRQQAAAQGREGYCLTLQAPSYLPVMQYADNRDLRRELYEAYSTRASDKGPNAGQWDNSDMMVEILQLREEQAKLLGPVHTK